jgi:type IV secretory pathway ATPase VirB11/archaellum biosynthesis ATPase
MKYGLVLPFDTDDPEFARGFEAGRVWELMSDGMPFEAVVHGANAEMYMRMAESLNLEITAEHMDDTWMMLKSAKEWS